MAKTQAYLEFREKRFGSWTVHLLTSGIVLRSSRTYDYAWPHVGITDITTDIAWTRQLSTERSSFSGSYSSQKVCRLLSGQGPEDFLVFVACPTEAVQRGADGLTYSW